MNRSQKWPGISVEILAFFKASDFRFDYGGDVELFRPGFHYVPTTRNIWLAGSLYAGDVIVSNSAMETIAWFVTNQHRYPDPSVFTFVSLGNLPTKGQLNWLEREFAGRKFSLLFGNCLLGRITDIWVALQFAGTDVALRWQNNQTEVLIKGMTWSLRDEQCSLNRFEKLSGFRTGIKTLKSRGYMTYLDKLIKDEF